jgi:hypothetical protein
MTTFTNLSPPATMVYETLQKYSDGKICQMSYNQIVEKSGYSGTTVNSAVKELSSGQWIKKIKGINKKQGHLTNKYELLNG